MKRAWVLAGLCLAIAGCPSRPSNDGGADAGNDVILAPIDTGVNNSDGAADSASDASDASEADGAPLDAGDAGSSDGAADASDAASDGPPRRCSDAGAGDSGCVVCPGTSRELLNQCTVNGCARFDNARCGRLLPDGGLPPLP